MKLHTAQFHKVPCALEGLFDFSYVHLRHVGHQAKVLFFACVATDLHWWDRTRWKERLVEAVEAHVDCQVMHEYFSLFADFCVAHLEDARQRHFGC